MARIFFFTFRSERIPQCAHSLRQFAERKSYTIKEIPEPGNAKRASLRSAAALPRAAAAVIMWRGVPDGSGSPLEEVRVMPAHKLTDPELKERLVKNKGWTLKDGKLHRAFQCKDFVAAFGNMTRVALVAESMNHHPEWFNVWNKVVFDLSTHSVNGISNLDFELAAKIDEIFGG